MTFPPALRTIALLLSVACGDDASRALVDARTDTDRDAEAGDAELPDAATACTVPDAAVMPPAPACTATGLPGSCIETSECRDSRTPVAGQCSGPATIQCCTPRFADGVTCDPNAAPDPNACLPDEAPGDPGCPPGMARVAAACIDRFEASLEGHSPYQPPVLPIPRAVSKANSIPQGHISQVEAGAACAAAGKRLCTNAEWLRACQGAAGATYPYGATRQPGVCNDARSVHPAVELYGTSAAWIYSHLDSPCLGQAANGLATTGSHPGCVTGDGVFDLMGNLHEWTADPAGTFRGGFYVDTRLNGDGCRYATTAHAASYADYSTGFRCCADPSDP